MCCIYRYLRGFGGDLLRFKGPLKYLVATQAQFDFRIPRPTLRALFFLGAGQLAEFEVQFAHFIFPVRLLRYAPEFLVKFCL